VKKNKLKQFFFKKVTCIDETVVIAVKYFWNIAELLVLFFSGQLVSGLMGVMG